MDENAKFNVDHAKFQYVLKLANKVTYQISNFTEHESVYFEMTKHALTDRKVS